jgi:hypothetical protein
MMSATALSIAIALSGAGVSACAPGTRTTTNAHAASTVESFLSIVVSCFLSVARQHDGTADPWRKLGTRRGIKRRQTFGTFSTRSGWACPYTRIHPAFRLHLVVPGRAKGANPE